MEIRFRRTWDRTAGDAISILSAIGACLDLRCIRTNERSAAKDSGRCVNFFSPLAYSATVWPLPEELELVGRQPFKPHGAARVQFAVADAQLRAEAVAVAVGEARRGVLKNAGRIHFVHELRRGG